MTNYYPLKLEPIASERLWGGTNLQSFVPNFATIQTQDPIGEAWLIYAGNKIQNGTFEGQTLQSLANTQGINLLGSKSVKRYGTKVPLLAKFLDAEKALSIQVHPDDDYALSQEAESGHLGKVEAWYILRAKPDASIIWGFKNHLSKDDIREAIKEGTLEQHLNHVPVKAGDIIYNPAGTVHAVGAGIMLFEIQQSSDLTYRLYDFNRKDASGNLRELHVEKALEVSDLNTGINAKIEPEQLSENVEQIVKSEYFVTEKWTINQKRLIHKVSDATLELITVIEGELTITSNNVEVKGTQADSFVLPAQLGELSFEGSASFMRCYLP